MIRQGRDVVDVVGIAAMQSISPKTAQDRQVWNESGFPAPVNAAVSTAGSGKRKRLWDKDQVSTYLSGEPIPAIPTDDHPDDLLELAEHAAMLDMNPSRLSAARRAGKVQPAHHVACGVEHWRRSASQELLTGGVRRRGRPTVSEAGQIRARLEAELTEMRVPPQTRVNVAELARRAQVDRAIAQSFLLSRAVQSLSGPDGAEVDVEELARRAHVTVHAAKSFLDRASR